MLPIEEKFWRWGVQDISAFNVPVCIAGAEQNVWKFLKTQYKPNALWIKMFYKAKPIIPIKLDWKMYDGYKN